MEQRPLSRFDRIVSDPDHYFEQAQQRASAQVDRQIERELRAVNEGSEPVAVPQKGRRLLGRIVRRR